MPATKRHGFKRTFATTVHQFIICNCLPLDHFCFVFWMHTSLLLANSWYFHLIKQRQIRCTNSTLIIVKYHHWFMFIFFSLCVIMILFAFKFPKSPCRSVNHNQLLLLFSFFSLRLIYIISCMCYFVFFFILNTYNRNSVIGANWNWWTIAMKECANQWTPVVVATTSHT